MKSKFNNYLEMARWKPGSSISGRRGRGISNAEIKYGYGDPSDRSGQYDPAKGVAWPEDPIAERMGCHGCRFHDEQDKLCLINKKSFPDACKNLANFPQ